MDDVELGVDFVFNEAEAKAAQDRIKKGLVSVGDTAELQTKRVEQAVQRVSVLDAATIAHIAKVRLAKMAAYEDAAKTIKTPEIANINNIKDVAKEVINLKKATEENNKVQDDGSESVGSLVGGMFSWASIITVAGGLLFTYRKEITAWVTEMWTGVSVNKDLEAAQEAVNTSLQNATTLIAKEIAETTISIEKLNNKNISLEKRGQLLDEFILNNPAILGALNLQNIATAEGVQILDNYLISLRKKIQLQQLEKSYTESVQKEADIKSGKEDTKAGWFPKAMVYTNDLLFNGFGDTEKKIKALDARYKANAETTQEAITKGLESQMKAAIDGEAKLKTVEEDNIKAREARVTTINERLRTLQKGESGKTLIAEKTQLEKEIKEQKLALGLEKPEKVKATKQVSDTTLKERSGLLSKLNDLDAEYSRKSFAKDEEELQALRDKFAKIRGLVLGFNNKNPKKAISLTALNATEVSAEGDLKYRQETKAQSIEFDRQKKLFADFESYKTTFGEEKARERFGNEVKSINDLRKEKEKEVNQLAAKAAIGALTGTGGLTGGESERLKKKSEEFAGLKSLDQKRYADAYEAALTSAQKIERINQEYTDKAKAIREQAAKDSVNPDDQIAVLNEKWQAEINGEKEVALRKTEIYKKLSEDALVLTREQVAKQIEIMKGLLKDPSLDGEAKSGVESLLKALEGRFKLGAKKGNTDALSKQKNNIINAINERVAQGITSPENKADLDKLYKDLAAVQEEINVINKTGLDQFFESFKGLGAVGGTAKALSLLGDTALGLSQALGGVDSEAGYTLDTIGQLAGTAADLGASLVSGDPVKIIGSAIKAVGTLFSIGKKVKEMNAAARKEVADFYANAISGEREYQDLLRERSLRTVKNNKTALTGIRDELKLRQEQTASWSKESAEIMAKLQGMQFVQDQSYKHGTWFRKAKVSKTMGSLASKSFAELSKLLAQGKLEGDAKALVERLKELEQKGYDGAVAYAEMKEQLTALFTGTSADALADSLLNLFKEGKTGAADFAEFFEETMSDAALTIFKNNVLADLMSTFYADFAEKAESDDELTENEISEMKTLFTSLTDKAKSKFEDLKKITGSDLGASPTKENQNTIKGDFKNLSEETGGVLAGRLAGVQLAMVELVAIKKNEVSSSLAEIKQQTQYQMEIAANTLITANNTEPLRDIKQGIDTLNASVKSTSNSLRAAGG